MANRDQARAFGAAFNLMAKYASNDHPDDIRKMAWELYKEARIVADFTLDQMGADEALIYLGLAHKKWNGDDIEVIYS